MICVTVFRMAVFKGRVSVEREDKSTGKVTKLELQAGSFFGEGGLLAEAAGRRNASVKALELCHLFMLRFTDFNTSLRDFPEYRTLIKVCSLACAVTLFC